MRFGAQLQALLLACCVLCRSKAVEREGHIDRDGALAFDPSELDGAELEIRSQPRLDTRLFRPARAPVSRQRVLVIGGTGFMGRAAVELLSRQGYNVTTLNRGKTMPGGHDGVANIKCDRLNDREGFIAHLRRVSS